MKKTTTVATIALTCVTLKKLYTDYQSRPIIWNVPDICKHCGKTI